MCFSVTLLVHVKFEGTAIYKDPCDFLYSDLTWMKFRARSSRTRYAETPQSPRLRGKVSNRYKVCMSSCMHEGVLQLHRYQPEYDCSACLAGSPHLQQFEISIWDYKMSIAFHVTHAAAKERKTTVNRVVVHPGGHSLAVEDIEYCRSPHFKSDGTAMATSRVSHLLKLHYHSVSLA